MAIRTHIPLENLINARHLGGFDTPEGRTKDYRFIRCEHPDALSETEANRLYALGVRTVIDLRSEGEVARSPSVFARDGRFRHRHISLIARDLSPGELIRRSGIDMGAFYIDILENSQEALGQVFAEMAAGEGGVLFHCTAGKDRTGIIAALLLRLAGVSRVDAEEEYAYTQELYASRREAILAGGAPLKNRADMEKMLAADRAYIQAALDYLDRTHADIGAFFRHLGLTDGQIAALRRKMVE